MPSELKLPFALRLIRKLNPPRKLGLLEALYGRFLASHGIRWVKCSNGITWKLDLADPTHRWIVFGDYEGGIGLDFARKVLRNGGIFVDSGSNIGQWLLYLAALPDVQTLAIEPVQSQRRWLEECLGLQTGWRCTTLAWGLGSKDCELEIQCDGARSTLRKDWYNSKQLSKEIIRVRKLDDILDEQGIESVQLWKLDVEGAEHDALLGAVHSLRSHRVKHLYFECHPSTYPLNKDLLEGFGYRLFDLDRHGLRPKCDPEIPYTQDLVAMLRATA